MQKVLSFSGTGQSTNSMALKRWLLLEQVDTSVVEQRKVFMIGCCKLLFYANESCDEHAVCLAMSKMMRHIHQVFDFWQWCNFSWIN